MLEFNISPPLFSFGGGEGRENNISTPIGVPPPLFLGVGEQYL